MTTSPKKYYSILAVILIAALFALLLYLTELGFLYCWLISISVVTFLIYGYDKQRAKNNGMRIPEIVLHLMALLGGSPGALLGQITFRHKIKKIKFVVVLWAIVLLQVIAIYVLTHYNVIG